MISVTSNGDLSASIDALGRQLTAANRSVGDRVAAVAKRETLAAAPMKRLSGMGAKLGVRTKVFAGAQTVTVDVQATPAGPWSIAESGRRGGYTVKPRKRRAVTPPKGPSASATVKRRTSGRKAWTKASAGAAEAIGREIEQVYDDALIEG